MSDTNINENSYRNIDKRLHRAVKLLLCVSILTLLAVLWLYLSLVNTSRYDRTRAQTRLSNDAITFEMLSPDLAARLQAVFAETTEPDPITGATGKQGAAGADGANGMDGKPGTDGATGLTGPPGASGTSTVLGGVISDTSLNTALSNQVLYMNVITNPDGGLTTTAQGLSLLANCSGGQILKWNGTSWQCGNDVVGSTASANLTSVNPGIQITGGIAAVLGSGTTISIADTSSASAYSGLLSRADWNAFGAKQTALTFGNVTSQNPEVTITGGSGAVVGGNVDISIATATSSRTGLLNSLDWTTFNNKENGLTINGRGLISRSGNTISATTCLAGQQMVYDGTQWSCGADVTYTAGAGIGISGNVISLSYSSLASTTTVAGSDELMIQTGSTSKRITYDNFFASNGGNVNYKGDWDASTNSPSLPTPCTTKGSYYVVSVAGAAALNTGAATINNWRVGDWAVCNGSVWQRIQATNIVASVFGRIGNVTASAGDYRANQVYTGTSGSTTVQNNLDTLQTDKLSKQLAQGLIFLGDGAGEAEGVALSGDATLDSSGNLTLAPSVVTSAKILDGSISFDDFAANGCLNGEVIKYSGSGFDCAADIDTGSTYTSSATAGNANSPITVNNSLNTIGLKDGTANGQYWAWNGTAWSLVTPAGGVQVGTLDSQTPVADGAQRIGNFLYLQSASTSFAGLVNTTTQSLAGNKTLTGDTTLGSTAANILTISGTAVSLPNGMTLTSAATKDISIITGTTGGLTLDSGTTGTINIGTNANAKTLTIGNLTGATGLVFNAGSGNVTFNTQSGVNSGVTINNTGSGPGLNIMTGSFATSRGTDITLSGTQNNLAISNSSLIRFTGTTAITITGIAGGVDGRELILMNAGSVTMTLAYFNASSLAANRIITGIGVNVVIPVGASALLKYDAGQGFWRVVGPGANVPISYLSAALTNNTIDNLAYTQVYAWSANASGTASQYTFNGLTSGIGQSFSSTATATTGNILNVTSASTGAFTNGGVRFNFSGAHTNNGLQIDDVTTTGTAAVINANALTTGSGLRVLSSSASITTAGSLVNFNQSSASAAGTTLSLGTAGSGLALAITSGGLSITPSPDFTTAGASNNVTFGNFASIRLNGSAAQTITGITGGTTGRMLFVTNVSSTISSTLAHQNTSSTAGNRIITSSGTDLILTPNTSAQLLYDATASAWRVFSTTASTQLPTEFQYVNSYSATGVTTSGRLAIPTNAKSYKVVITNLSSSTASSIGMNLYDSGNTQLTAANYNYFGTYASSASSNAVSTGLTGASSFLLGLGNAPGSTGTANGEIIIRGTQSTTGNPATWTMFNGGTAGSVSASGRYTGTTVNTGGFSLTASTGTITYSVDVYAGY